MKARPDRQGGKPNAVSVCLAGLWVAIMIGGKVYGASGTRAEGDASSTALAGSPAAFLEDLKEASSVKVLLVPQQISMPVTLTKDHMEGTSCVYESATPAAKTALLQILARNIRSVSHGDAPGMLGNTRTAIVFLRDTRVPFWLYFADGYPDGAPGVFDGGRISAHDALRSHLEEWIKRSDVMRTGLPASASGNPNYTGCPR